MKKSLIFYLMMLFLPCAFSVAEIVDEVDLDMKTREVAKTLRCAVCQTESVWESNAELARQMRQIIRERLAEGQSAEEIKAYFLSRYGDYILLKPRKSGLNWVLWAGPFIMLGIGGGLLYLTLRRWVARSSTVRPEEPQPIDEFHRQRIEQELRSHEE